MVVVERGEDEGGVAVVVAVSRQGGKEKGKGEGERKERRRTEAVKTFVTEGWGFATTTQWRF